MVKVSASSECTGYNAQHQLLRCPSPTVVLRRVTAAGPEPYRAGTAGAVSTSIIRAGSSLAKAFEAKPLTCGGICKLAIGAQARERVAALHAERCGELYGIVDAKAVHAHELARARDDWLPDLDHLARRQILGQHREVRLGVLLAEVTGVHASDERRGDLDFGDPGHGDHGVAPKHLANMVDPDFDEVALGECTRSRK